jgi:hypothetical protein
MSQFLCAQRSGSSRMRLSLAETGQIDLSEQEEEAMRRVLNEYISAKAREIVSLRKTKFRRTSADNREEPERWCWVTAGVFRREAFAVYGQNPRKRSGNE